MCHKCGRLNSTTSVSMGSLIEYPEYVDRVEVGCFPQERQLRITVFTPTQHASVSLRALGDSLEKVVELLFQCRVCQNQRMIYDLLMAICPMLDPDPQRMGIDMELAFSKDVAPLPGFSFGLRVGHPFQ